MEILESIRRVVEGLGETREGNWGKRQSYRWLRLEVAARCGESEAEIAGFAQAGLKDGGIKALWGCWVWGLSRRLAGESVDDIALALWEEGVRMQDGNGYLQGASAEMFMEVAVYDELCGIHAAYGAALILGGEERMERVRRAVRWHAENTQADHVTREPWGLAAFARLDETGTFAGQQLHDAVFALNGIASGERGGSVIARLLAEGLWMLENDF